jgi:hypothetical protein
LAERRVVERTQRGSRADLGGPRGHPLHVALALLADDAAAVAAVVPPHQKPKRFVARHALVRALVRNLGATLGGGHTGAFYQQPFVQQRLPHSLPRTGVRGHPYFYHIKLGLTSHPGLGCANRLQHVIQQRIHGGALAHLVAERETEGVQERRRVTREAPRGFLEVVPRNPRGLAADSRLTSRSPRGGSAASAPARTDGIVARGSSGISHRDSPVCSLYQ